MTSSNAETDSKPIIIIIIIIIIIKNMQVASRLKSDPWFVEILICVCCVLMR